MQRSYLPFLATVCLLSLGHRASAADADAAGIAFFEAKIRPVLVDQCYSCHSDVKQRGGLRLDTRAALLKGGDSGAVVLAGKPNESLLLKALRHDGVKMPPKNKLAANVIADFAKWIEMGIPDPRDGTAIVAAQIDFTKARQFWSFQTPRAVELPKVQNPGAARNGIDHFILAKLDSAKLQPVKSADKRALIRRATYDLIGLPATPEEVEEFLKDDSPRAFEKVIDRLLASPHYGERWARHWLDVARYAEDQAHTFGVEPNTSAWRYRDWVVQALNQDMPYDRFVKLQIAADLIETDEAERLKHLPALGFIGLGAQYYKNTDAAKAAADELDDRVDTLSRAFLGLTVSCARCHDHKFDPIPTQDYYSLAGVFQSTRLANLPLAPAAEVRVYQEALKQAREVEGKFKAFVRAERTIVNESQAAEIARYMQAVRKYQARRLEQPKWSVAEQAKQDNLQTAALDRWVKYLSGNPKVAALNAWRELPQPATPAGKEETGITAAESFQKFVQASLVQQAKGKIDKDGAALLQVLFGDNGVFVVNDQELKARLPAEKRQQFVQMEQDLAKLRKEAPEKIGARFALAHALVEAAPTDMKVFVRGNPAKLGEVAPRRFLRILAGDTPTAFSRGSGRLDLAEAITSKDNPLTARVLVNRLWQQHFGRGIVGTPSNFGQLGERPTHPELLDYLACRFVASGWSIKALHRDLMLSGTYQLSSAADERNLASDADNRNLWRMNRRRLDIEAWRDAILAVSGKLDRTMGGASLDLAAGENRRRTVYGKVSRHELNALLRLFDFPDANITSETRIETTVPQQQLFVLNSAFVVDHAKAFAARMQAESKDDASRVQRGYLLAYGRAATGAEVERVLRYVGMEDSADEKAKNKLTRWERFAQALLGSNEFLYID
ncbi:MAG: PSD1 and planctomycete cytochrome C domain-containing protein [Gemmataceae bacterium]|nr:PSD1 and planctomycete cytochrome C domain-containing protein [Gemmataceae bacterium]